MSNASPRLPSLRTGRIPTGRRGMSVAAAVLAAAALVAGLGVPVGGAPTGGATPAPAGVATGVPAAAPPATGPAVAGGAVGAFAARGDVGRVGRPGSAAFDPATGGYRVSGCGENMWKAADAFHFVYSPAAGDMSIEAVVRLDEVGGNPHRKAGLVVRQGRGADAAYADVVAHGDGSVHLQYRAVAGGPTANADRPDAAPAAKSATAPATGAGKATAPAGVAGTGIAPAPVRLRLERRGDVFAAFVATDGGSLRPLATVTLALADPVYVGLAVCSHDAAAEATAVFTEVAVKAADAAKPAGTAKPGDAKAANEAKPADAAKPADGAKPAAGTDVRVERNLRYVPDGDPAQVLDLYLPKAADGAGGDGGKPLPLVVWVHGGGWRGGSKAGCPLRYLVADGYAVASVEYRFSQKAVFPAQIQDCQAALRWLRANAKTYNLDPAKVGVGGDSAGGHLSALLGTAGGAKAFSPIGGNDDQPDRAQAVCDFYGPADFNTVVAQAAAEAAAGGPKNVYKFNTPTDPYSGLIGVPLNADPAKGDAVSPVHFVSKDDPPFLILHGTADPQVPFAQSVELANALKAAGVEATLQRFPGGGHGGPAFHSPAVHGLIKTFFDKHLKGADVKVEPLPDAAVTVTPAATKPK
jgi:acetyl esterase/lipase